MITPSPRGYPRQSLERTICESLALGTVPASHWSWQPPRTVRNSKPRSTPVVTADSINAALAVLMAGVSGAGGA